MTDSQAMLMTPISTSVNVGSGTPSQAPTRLQTASLRDLDSLCAALNSKIYFSGPLVYYKGRDDYTLSDLYRVRDADDDRINMWAELKGTTLRSWPIKQYQKALSEQKDMTFLYPKIRVNATDTLIRAESSSVTFSNYDERGFRQYTVTNVLSLNYDESYNYRIFSCPSEDALRTWTAALHLCAWENSRLEEIYTAYLIRNALRFRDKIPATGKMEGYAGVYVSGQSSQEWKRVWVVIQPGANPSSSKTTKGIFDLFTRETATPLISTPTSTSPKIILCAGPSSKHLKTPLMTIHNVTQAYSVYPGRPELIGHSALMKIEGTFGDEDMADPLKSKEGWIKIMPEFENSASHVPEMMKWIAALHDIFGLYGRPKAWTWDVNDPTSLVFGYPEDPTEKALFLDPEIIERVDSSEERTSVIRAEMTKLLQAKPRSDRSTYPPGEAGARSTRN